MAEPEPVRVKDPENVGELVGVTVREKERVFDPVVVAECELVLDADTVDVFDKTSVGDKDAVGELEELVERERVAVRDGTEPEALRGTVQLRDDVHDSVWDLLCDKVPVSEVVLVVDGDREPTEDELVMVIDWEKLVDDDTVRVTEVETVPLSLLEELRVAVRERDEVGVPGEAVQLTVAEVVVLPERVRESEADDEKLVVAEMLSDSAAVSDSFENDALGDFVCEKDVELVAERVCVRDSEDDSVADNVLLFEPVTDELARKLSDADSVGVEEAVAVAENVTVPEMDTVKEKLCVADTE